jgi:uncharacterized protein (DUF1501 family)
MEAPRTPGTGTGTGTAGRPAKPPVLVIVQLSGGNDFMNTLIPYTQGIYYDTRPTVGIPEDQVLPISDTLGFHPAAGPLRELYREGHVAVVQGIGYENASRSHFRALDIWHTCEPEKVATEGWVARVVRELDPQNTNPLTAVSFGRGLPRALAAPGVRATSVDNLDTYGLLSGIEAQAQREQDLEIFKRMYTPAVGAGLVADYLRQTGQGVLDGADRLKLAIERYDSPVQYGTSAIARSLRDVARVHTAGLGTRVFYTQQGGYDHHAQELPSHQRLLGELTGALTAFTQDLRQHDAADNVAILVFTEFGRRIRDNGSGTDHGSGGGAFVLGEHVKGGLYSEYPSLAPDDWLNGEDLRHTVDFRTVYSTMLEQWMGLEARPIVGGAYEQLPLF